MTESDRRYSLFIAAGKAAAKVVFQYYQVPPDSQRIAELAFNECPAHASRCYIAICRSLSKSVGISVADYSSIVGKLVNSQHSDVSTLSVFG